MLKRLVMVAALLVGCGGDDASGNDVDGYWLIEGEDCLLTLTLDNGDFELATLCPLEDGGVGIEVDRGTFKDTGGDLVFSPDESSCAGDEHGVETLSYDFVGEQLRLMTPNSVLVFERGKKASGNGPGGTAQYGCYDSDGVFTPMPVIDL